MTTNNAPNNSTSSKGADKLTPMRLQKFLARAGVASRRASEQLILDGRVAVNGCVVTELGTKVHVACPQEDSLLLGSGAEEDRVTLDGVRVVLRAASVTLMLNKPAGYVTTMSDPQGRPCVASLVPLEQYPSLFPVGRLDRDTTGLLLFSTDGELGNVLLHPRHHVEKTYLALVAGHPSTSVLEKLRSGVCLSDGMTQPARVEVLVGEQEQQARVCFAFHEPGASGTSNASRKMQNKRSVKAAGSTVVRISITEGRNRQVRRMFDTIGHPVIALHRCSFGPVSLGDLSRGSWRLLTREEVAALAMSDSFNL